MLFEMSLALLGIAVAGFGMAAYWDLRTTEFPDWLPYIMIAGAVVVRGAVSLLLWDFSYIIYSIIIGGLFLGFGLLLYYLKQWGDGDAWLLGVLGFLFPGSAGFSPVTILPFPVAMLFNFFLISFFYLLVYSVFLGLRAPETSRKFLKEINGARLDIGKVVGAFTVAIVVLIAWMSWQLALPIEGLLYLLLFSPVLLSVLVFTRYGRFVEANLFKKKVPAVKLRAGDVLVSDKWRGLTEKEVKELKRKGKDVWIKEGVRFAPVFVITVLVTLFWGSMLVLFI